MFNRSRFDSNFLIENRQIRVFLSSTFSDMEAERIALIKTFGALKIEANRRNVELTIIDLRWGVTEEEARSGKVLSVCLNEIENSHPFFIGLLGSRYGYAPEMSEIEKNPELKERYPWVVEDISDGLSITEMEMEYGVLRNAADIDAAFFIKQSDLPDDNPKLTSLKAKIRNQKQYPVAEYSTIEQLCKQAEDELRRILDRHFPETEITPLDRERAAQRAYINSRHANYLKRQSYFDIIDDFVHSDEQNLVFTGDSGVGKSALLANWVKENENNDDFNIIYHFVGNSFSDNSYENILRHICDEICYLYCIERKEEKRDVLWYDAQWLMSIVATREQPLVIVIDGINQILVSEGNEKLLIWLPDANKKIKYIFSTLSKDETMRVFEQRGYRVETVLPLSPKDREHFVVGYLDNFGKRLSDNQLRRIVNDTENINTLVLKSLLDELICFGSYEHLDSRIEYYLSAPSITDFFDRVLARMEYDYSANEDLVSHALTLIAVSERGLSEDELLSIIGCRQLDWHLFFCAFYNHFIVKNGLITFSHQYMVSAVERRYHTIDNSQTVYFRQEVISYFNKVQNEDKSVADRRVSELAHQCYNLADWDSLYGILLDFDAFDYFYGSNQPLLGFYWRKLISVDKDCYTLSGYMQLSTGKNESALASEYSNIADFVATYIADYQLTLAYYMNALKIWEKLFERNLMSECYNGIGYIYKIISDYNKAIFYHSKAIEIQEEIWGREHINLAYSYSYIGMSYADLCKYDKALECYRNSEKIFKKYGEEGSHDIAMVYSNIGEVYAMQENCDDALKYYYKSLEIIENIYGTKHPDTAVIYNNIANVYYREYEYDKAFVFAEKALGIRIMNFGEEHPDTAKSFVCKGLVYANKGKFEQAHECLGNALNVFEKVFEKGHLNIALCEINIGSVYGLQGDLVMALEFYNKGLKILEKSDAYKQDLAKCYWNIGAVYYQQGDFYDAFDCYCKSLDVAEMIFGENHQIMDKYNEKIACCYIEMKDYQNALIYLQKAFDINKKYGIEDIETSRIVYMIGLVYHHLKEHRKSLEYCHKALDIHIKLGIEDELTAKISNIIGEDYYFLKKSENALEYCRNALCIHSQLGIENSNTAIYNNNLYYVCYGLEKFQDALVYGINALEIRKRLENENITADSYNNVGNAYFSLKEYQKALIYYQKALDHVKLGLVDSQTVLFYNNIGSVYNACGEYQKALEYHLKALEIFEEKLEGDSTDLAFLYYSIGCNYHDMKEYHTALDYYQKALDIHEKLELNDSQTALFYNNIGSAYNACGEYLNALEYHLKALDIRERFLGVKHSDTGWSYYKIGADYNAIGSYDKALEYYNKAYNIYKYIFGKDHPDTIAVLESIKEVRERLNGK